MLRWPLSGCLLLDCSRRKFRLLRNDLQAFECVRVDTPKTRTGAAISHRLALLFDCVWDIAIVIDVAENGRDIWICLGVDFAERRLIEHFNYSCHISVCRLESWVIIDCLCFIKALWTQHLGEITTRRRCDEQQ